MDCKLNSEVYCVAISVGGDFSTHLIDVLCDSEKSRVIKYRVKRFVRILVKNYTIWMTTHMTIK